MRTFKIQNNLVTIQNMNMCTLIGNNTQGLVDRCKVGLLKYQYFELQIN